MRRILGIGIASLFLLLAFIGIFNFVVEETTADTTESGHISTDTTWELENSPYWIEENVIVDNGATLTIEAGVEVKFNGSFTLYVNGNLSAIGTAGNKIVFTSNTMTPSKGDWDGIQVNSTGHCNIEYCNITCGYSSIYLHYSSNNTIINSNISNNYYGIDLDHSLNNTIWNCTILNNSYLGIRLYFSSNNNTVANCNIASNGGCGISVYSSSNNIITNNQMWNNELINLYIGGSEKQHFNHTIDTLNTINGKEVHYYFDLQNETKNDLDTTHITLAWCTNVTLRNCSVNDGDFIYLPYTQNSTIEWYNSSNNYASIYLDHSNDNIITNCNLSSNNGDGTFLYNSSNNTITNCNISLNDFYGVNITTSSNNNRIHHNNFMDNTNQAHDNYTNHWDDGIEGNYWSDYEGVDGDNNGIGDTPYYIPDGTNQDHFPLMKPLDFIPPIVRSTYPNNGQANVPLNATIAMTFSEAMNKTSVEGNVTISPITAVDSYQWSDENKTVALITPLLSSETNYIVTINTNAKDLVGYNLQSQYQFSFTTEDATQPTIVSIFPPDLSTNISITANITITFSEAMNQTTTQNAFTIKTNNFSVDGTFHWNERNDTMTFNPSFNLISETKYWINTSTNATDVAGNPLFAQWNSSFTTEDITPPTILSTFPTNGQANVPLNTTITITFSEEMNKTSVESNIAISPTTAIHSYQWSSDNNTVTFTMPLLSSETNYIVTINTNAKDLVGYNLQSQYQFSFTTEDTTQPTIVSVFPPDLLANISVSTNITISFSEAMNQTTTQNAFTIKTNNFSVDGTFHWNERNDTMTFDPSFNLTSETKYWINISTNATDAAGNSLSAPWISSFTTEDITPPTVLSTFPTDGQTNVPLNTTITITFSEEMNKTSTQNAIEISQGLISASFNWSNNNKTISFTISSLQLNTQYIITINATIAEDIAKNKLDGNEDGNGGDDYIWFFTTEEKVTPPSYLLTQQWLIILSLIITATVIIIAIGLVLKKKEFTEGVEEMVTEEAEEEAESKGEEEVKEPMQKPPED